MVNAMSAQPPSDLPRGVALTGMPEEFALGEALSTLRLCRPRQRIARRPGPRQRERREEIMSGSGPLRTVIPHRTDRCETAFGLAITCPSTAIPGRVVNRIDVGW